MKRILGSRWVRLIFSAILVYLAFRKVDVIQLWQEIQKVRLEYVIIILAYVFGIMILGGWRWSLLLINKPTWNDIWAFTKATYRGSFYGLFFPTAMAGDLLKWTPIKERYPDFSKTKIAGSVLIDRIIGLSAFAVMGVLALIVGKILRYQFPDFLLWLFILINVGLVGFFGVVSAVKLEKFEGKYQILDKIISVLNLLKGENRKQILKAFLISLVAEPLWQMPFWFYSLIFKSGITLGLIMIFMPVISLILVLPISVAGFGARENLFLFFLEPLGFASEKILLVSTFGGIINVIVSLIGGIFLLI